MRHLGMKLQAINSALDIAHRCRRTILSRPQNFKPFWQCCDHIAVAHPNHLRIAKPGKQIRPTCNIQPGRTVFSPPRQQPPRPQVHAQQLMPITQAEHGQIRIQQLGIKRGRIGIIHTGRPTRKNHARHALQCRRINIRRENFGINPQPANSDWQSNGHIARQNQSRQCRRA